MIKLLAFDMDGTLTQHRTPIEPEHYRMLEQLSARYAIVIVSAGDFARISAQIGNFPADILGNYGMQVALREGNGYRIAREIRLPADRPSVAARIAALRARFGYQDCKGDGVFFYDSGMVTFPLLGTAAPIKEKLRFDPDRGKRRRMLPAVREAFPEYTVALAGSSSFDIMPRAFDKARALGEYAAERGILKREVLFIGDDLGEGGGDRPVLEAGFPCFAVQDYRELPARLAFLTEAL